MVTQRTIDYLTLFGIFFISLDLASYFHSLGKAGSAEHAYSMYTAPLGVFGVILVVLGYFLSRRQAKDGKDKAAGGKNTVKLHESARAGFKIDAQVSVNM